LLMVACVLPWLLLEGVFFWRMRKRHRGGDSQ